MIKKVIGLLAFCALVALLAGCPSESSEEASLFGTWANASVTWEVGTLNNVVITLNENGTFVLTYQTTDANTQSGTFAPADPSPNTSITFSITASSGPDVPPAPATWWLQYANLTAATVDIYFDANSDGFEGPDTFQRQ